jgi:hypothetical protein
MKYKDIEYMILKTTNPDIWAWSFNPPGSLPVTGRCAGSRGMAVAAVQRAIRKWMKSSADDKIKP